MIRYLLAALLASAPAPVLAQNQAKIPAVPVQAPAAPPLPAAYPQGVLSDAVQPQAYRLDLSVDPGRERFSGKVEIDALIQRPSATSGAGIPRSKTGAPDLRATRMRAYRASPVMPGHARRIAPRATGWLRSRRPQASPRTCRRGRRPNTRAR